MLGQVVEMLHRTTVVGQTVGPISFLDVHAFLRSFAIRVYGQKNAGLEIGHKVAFPSVCPDLRQKLKIRTVFQKRCLCMHHFVPQIPKVEFG